MDRMRSTVSNNLVLPSSSRLDRSSDSSVPVRCHGPLCKSYICYIDTLPIGHSVLIQLKANLRLRYFQSVNANHIELILEDFSIFFLSLEIRSFKTISYRLECQCTSARNPIKISWKSLVTPANCFP